MASSPAWPWQLGVEVQPSGECQGLNTIFVSSGGRKAVSGQSPELQGSGFTLPFVPSPVPVLPARPPASSACGGDDAGAAVWAARPAAPSAPQPSAQGHARHGRAWGAVAAADRRRAASTIPTPACLRPQGKAKGRGDKIKRLKILKTKQNCPSRQWFCSVRAVGTGLGPEQRFCRIAACLSAGSVAPAAEMQPLARTAVPCSGW